MADDKGNALSPDLLPPQRPHGSTAHDKPKPCIACGGHHGGVNAKFLCQENEILRLRAVIRQFAPHSGGHE
jgi:hypothetical protein